ncbi:MAG: tyrosine-type recombinase/integrase [Dehalococcoidales bacterium]|nr:tyrosine-type recombinase/integrase [Dehalococcoidales bacterium]
MTKAYLEPQDVEKLEQAAEYLRDRLLIRLLFRLGCRISEALGITVDDIDFGESTVTIKHLKERVRLSCPRCGARLARAHRFCSVCGFDVDQALSQVREQRRFRTLPVDAETLGMLKEYVGRKGPRSRGGRLLLFGINRHRAWQIVRHCAERAGLPRLKNAESGKVHGVSPHRLRDAFAVHAVKINDSGDGIRMLQEHLGHQSIATTMRYRKVSGEEQRQWFDKLWEENKAKGERNGKA